MYRTMLLTNLLIGTLKQCKNKLTRHPKIGSYMDAFNTRLLDLYNCKAKASRYNSLPLTKTINNKKEFSQGEALFF